MTIALSIDPIYVESLGTLHSDRNISGTYALLSTGKMKEVVESGAAPKPNNGRTNGQADSNIPPVNFGAGYNYSRKCSITVCSAIW